jgi:mRNA interferase RelE/StbE
VSRYGIRYSSRARRALTSTLPESIAAAAYELITGALSENPQRLGKQLSEPLYPLYSARRGEYRVIYRIKEDHQLIEILSIDHRRDAYRL